tara:strand:+ start:366 stop:485 length:120 start_codon:yes stop_codon:yes gene_type:complete
MFRIYKILYYKITTPTQNTREAEKEAEERQRKIEKIHNY